MKKNAKKLVLTRETVRDLKSFERLKEAAGGQRTIEPTCGVSCFWFDTCFC